MPLVSLGQVFLLKNIKIFNFLNQAENVEDQNIRRGIRLDAFQSFHAAMRSRLVLKSCLKRLLGSVSQVLFFLK